MDRFSHFVFPPLFLKRSAQQRKQFTRFFIGFRGGDEADVHTTDLVNFIVVNFREDKLFFEAHVVVAAAVKGWG